MTMNREAVEVPATLAVETHGIDPIPAKERWSRPRDVFGLIFGGANSISTALLGTFPIVFGLTFWDGALSILIGVVLGSVILAPMVFFGPRTGTNNAVSSSAHFGAHGRLIGSLLALLGAFTFLALAVWASGDALLAALARVFGFAVTDASTAVVYVAMTLLLIAVCIFGYRLLVLLNRFAPPLVGVLFAIGIAAYAVQPAFAKATATVGGHWSDPVYVASFFGCMLIAMSCPISYGPFLGDYARYVPDTVNKGRLVGAVILSQTACLLAFYFGLITAAAIEAVKPGEVAAGGYAGGLLQTAPTWFFIPLAIIGVIGGASTGASLLYGTGLDFSSIVARLSRVQSTILIGVVALVFVLVGKFVFNVVQSVTTLSTLVVICTVPWIAIMVVGYFTRRGWYDSDALQVFNRRQMGGRYWYTHGWNVSAVVSWAVSTALALLFVNLPGQFVGPLAGIAGGADISLPVALISAAIVYGVLLFLVPEQRFLYGPDGARAVPTRDSREPMPILPTRFTPMSLPTLAPEKELS